MKKLNLALLLVLASCLGCSGGAGTNGSEDGDGDLSELESDPAAQTPSDDPGDYPAGTAKTYRIEASDPRWVVPSEGLPASLKPDVANNNVDIVFFAGRLFMAWRTAPNHFASTKTRLLVVSSADQGLHWNFEDEIAMGSDVREPRFLTFKGRLHLYFFEAGTDMLAFEPKRMWRATRIGAGVWEAPAVAVDGPEVPWDLKVRNGKTYLTSYKGNHYETGESKIEVYFKESDDGVTFTKVGGNPYVYKGGVSEVAFEFDTEGNLWAVTRNEDGDSSGFGSHVCFAPKAALSEWECSPHSDPNRYDSPEMFRHGDEIYLVARRDVGGPYDEGRKDLPFAEQKNEYLKNYSLRPKGSALYRIDRDKRQVEKLFDLPGCGDNAFPAVRRLDTDRFLLANYSNPLDMTDVTWLAGQTTKRGTQIYFLTLNFLPAEQE